LALEFLEDFLSNTEPIWRNWRLALVELLYRDGTYWWGGLQDQDYCNGKNGDPHWTLHKHTRFSFSILQT
jgi:hypothetical protein